MQTHQKFIGAGLALTAVTMGVFVYFSGGVEQAVRRASEAAGIVEPDPFDATPAPPSAPPPEITRDPAVDPAPPASQGIVRGTVYGLDRNPAPNAAIKITRMAWAEGIQRRHAPGAGQSTLADASGGFAIEGLPWGQYNVEAMAADAKGSETVDVRLGKSVAGVTIYMVETGPIHGRVVNDRGNPVAGAELLAFAHNGVPRDGMLWETPAATTGLDGTFRMENLEGITWHYLVRADGYADTTSRYLPVGGPAVTITLQKGVIVTGTVYEETSGTPVSGFPLVVELIHHAVSDAEGKFQVHMPPWSDPAVPIHGVDDTYVLAHVVTAQDRFMEDGVVHVDVPVVKAVTVRGRVYDRDTGEGLPGCRVQANSPHNGYAAATDASGHYEITGLAPGRTEVRVAQPPRGYSESFARRNPRHLDSTAGMAMENYDFPMRKGMPVSGVVVDAGGQPVAGAHVHGRFVSGPEDANVESQEADTSDENGAFLLACGGSQAVVYFSARSEAGEVMNAGPTTVPSEGLAGVRLVLSSPLDGVIAGRVVDSRGRPVRTTVAIGLSIPGDVPPGFSDHHRQYTDINGQFAFTNLPRLNYYIWLASPTDHQIGLADAGPGIAPHNTINLAQRPQVTGIRLVAREYANTGGRVTNTAGDPIPVVTMQLERAEGETAAWDRHRAHTDRNGKYVFDRAEKGGQYLVRIADPRYPEMEAGPVTAGSMAVNFTVPVP